MLEFNFLLNYAISLFIVIALCVVGFRIRKFKKQEMGSQTKYAVKGVIFLIALVILFINVIPDSKDVSSVLQHKYSKVTGVITKATFSHISKGGTTQFLTVNHQQFNVRATFPDYTQNEGKTVTISYLPHTHKVMEISTPVDK